MRAVSIVSKSERILTNCPCCSLYDSGASQDYYITYSHPNHAYTPTENYSHDYEDSRGEFEPDDYGDDREKYFDNTDEYPNDAEKQNIYYPERKHSHYSRHDGDSPNGNNDPGYYVEDTV